MGERKGNFEAAEVVGQSKKKEGQWVLRFASDGKCIAKMPEQIRLVDAAAVSEIKVAAVAVAVAGKPTSSTSTIELVAGKTILAERKGGFELAEVVGPSRKKEGQW